MEEKIKKEIEYIKKVGLTQKEKEVILRDIIGEEKSPYPYTESPKTFWDIFYVHKSFSYTFSAIMVLFIFTTASAFSAENSLPGDFLYPLKVGVNEKARGLIKLSPQSKASWEAEKALRRIDEGLLLAQEEKLDDEKLLKIEENFNKHTEDFENSLKSVATSSLPQKEELEEKFKNNLTQKADSLKEVTGKDNEDHNDQRERVRSLENTIREKLNNKKDIGEVRGATNEKNINNNNDNSNNKNSDNRSLNKGQSKKEKK